MLWEGTVRAMAARAVEDLECFARGGDDAISRAVGDYVVTVIDDLPWHFALPLKIHATLLAVLGLLVAGGLPGSVVGARRRRQIRVLSLVPLFGVLDRLVKALALLNLFDHPSILATLPPPPKSRAT